MRVEEADAVSLHPAEKVVKAGLCVAEPEDFGDGASSRPRLPLKVEDIERRFAPDAELSAKDAAAAFRRTC